MIIKQDLDLVQFRRFCKEAGIDPPTWWERKVIEKVADKRSGRTLLEVGSGYGRLVPFLSKMCEKNSIKLSLCEPDERYKRELELVAGCHNIQSVSIIEVEGSYDTVLAPFAFLMLFPHDVQERILEHMLTLGRRVAVDITLPVKDEHYIMTQKIPVAKKTAVNTAFVQPLSWYREIARKRGRKVSFVPYLMRNWSWLHLYAVFD